MSNTDTGGPAFPRGEIQTAPGMTLRDYFAAKAMQGWITTYPNEAAVQDVNSTGIANFAYEMADAMLKAREA